MSPSRSRCSKNERESSPSPSSAFSSSSFCLSAVTSQLMRIASHLVRPGGAFLPAGFCPENGTIHPNLRRFAPGPLTEPLAGLASLPLGSVFLRRLFGGNLNLVSVEAEASSGPVESAGPCPRLPERERRDALKTMLIRGPTLCSPSPFRTQYRKSSCSQAQSQKE